MTRDDLEIRGVASSRLTTLAPDHHVRCSLSASLAHSKTGCDSGAYELCYTVSGCYGAPFSLVALRIRHVNWVLGSSSSFRSIRKATSSYPLRLCDSIALISDFIVRLPWYIPLRRANLVRSVSSSSEIL